MKTFDEIKVVFKPRTSKIYGTPDDLASLLMMAAKGEKESGYEYPNGHEQREYHWNRADRFSKMAEYLWKAELQHARDKGI